MNAPVEQYLPTSVVLKSETTSGAAAPVARMPWVSVSLVTFLTTLTWMLGCSFSKLAMLALIAATSLGWLQPCQKVMVTGLSLLPRLPCEPLVDWPVQAATRERAAAQPAAAAARRSRRGSIVTGPPLRDGDVR